MDLTTIGIIAGSSLFGLAITAGSLFFVWKAISGFQKASQQTAQLMAQGVPAQARVLGVQDLGGSIRIMDQLPQHRLQIHLEVHPQGIPPFQASAVQLVTAFHFSRIQRGAIVEVRYDPADPTRVAVVL